MYRPSQTKIRPGWIILSYFACNGSIVAMMWSQCLIVFDRRNNKKDIWWVIRTLSQVSGTESGAFMAVGAIQSNS